MCDFLIPLVKSSFGKSSNHEKIHLTTYAHASKSVYVGMDQVMLIYSGVRFINSVEHEDICFFGTRTSYMHARATYVFRKMLRLLHFYTTLCTMSLIEVDPILFEGFTSIREVIHSVV